MRTFRYDGSPDGFLTAVRLALGQSDPVAFQAAAGEGPVQGMLFDADTVATDANSAAALLQDLETAAGRGTVRDILHGFLGEHPRRDDLLFEGIRGGLHQRCPLHRMTCRPAQDLLKLVRQVGHEIHLFHGLLRFSELADGTFYAPFEPDHNVLIPVARHFTVRLRDQQWVVHDCKRDLAVHWDRNQLRPIVAANSAGHTLEMAEDEAAYQACWRTYTQHIAIESRLNPRLQRQFMPRRFWRYLTEIGK